MSDRRSLYHITADLQAIEDLLFEAGGDVSDPDAAEAIDAWFAENQQALEEKADNYGALIQTLQRRAEARKAEADRLAELAAIDQSSAVALKTRLLGALQTQGIKKLETARFRFSVCGNGGKQPLNIDEDNVTPEFLRHEPVVDTDAIRAALDSGEELSFARYEPRGQHLRIK